MNFVQSHSKVWMLLLSFFVFSSVLAETSIDEKRAVALMRKIGHQYLLQDNDTKTRVLPVTKEGDQFTIQFDKKFELKPGILVQVVQDELPAINGKETYLVEVRDESTSEIVYSYEGSVGVDTSSIACRSRAYPVGSYAILITFLKNNGAIVSERENEAQSLWLWIGGITLFLILVIVLRKLSQTDNATIVKIGDFSFNTATKQLFYQTQDLELSHKEAELLYLLYQSANQTIEREDLLRLVWGDEGHYVGRTLDVFISKLRKKLEGDPKVKISNVRGVGYRLVIG